MQVHQDFRYMSDQKHDPNLTPQAVLLLEALREANDWINRSELARRTEKSALNKWDMVLLGKLADAGLIETRQIPRHGPIGYEWQYRAVQIDHDAESAG
jgi:predicted transcriptional regulator